MLQLGMLAKAIELTNKNPFFYKQLESVFKAIPYDVNIANWLVDKSHNTNINVKYLCADFFSLLYLRDVVSTRSSCFEISGSDTTFLKSKAVDPIVAKWQAELTEVAVPFFNFADNFMFTYLCAATAGELRHFPNKTNGTNKQINKWGITSSSGTSRNLAQQKFFAFITAAQLKNYFEDACRLFNDYTWHGSFGGKKWGVIAQTALDRLTGALDPILFIDRVFDLKHNGGPVFDKSSAVHQGNLMGFLNKKLEILTDAQWNQALKETCSVEVNGLINKAVTINIWKAPQLWPLKMYPTYSNLEVITKGKNIPNLTATKYASSEPDADSDSDSDDNSSNEEKAASSHSNGYQLPEGTIQFVATKTACI